MNDMIESALHLDAFVSRLSSAHSLAILASGNSTAAILACSIVLALVSAGLLASLLILCRRRKGLPSFSELDMLRAAFENIPDPLYVKDSQSRFLLANDAAARNMGATRGSQLIGKTDFDFFPAPLAQSFFDDEKHVLATSQPLVSREEEIVNAAGRTHWVLSTKVPLFDPQGRPVGLVGIGRNITKLKSIEAELLKAREELEFKAAHDSLTSLLNHGAVLDMLERELSRSRRQNSSLAVLMGDLDHFKAINDMHGHLVGDQVLHEVAIRLLATVRPYDLVGRYGGEEFLIVLPNCQPKDALNRADQLRVAVSSSPIPASVGPLAVSVSIGVLALHPSHELSAAAILATVDAALYDAKSAGRNCCRVASQPQLVALGA